MAAMTPNLNHHQQQQPTVNLKPVTSIQQVLYHGQASYQASNNHSKVNGHHQDFEMIKVGTLPSSIYCILHSALKSAKKCNLTGQCTICL